MEIYTQAGERIWSHWRCMEKGRCFTVKANYEKRYRIATEMLTTEVLRIYESQAMLNQLKRRFPRHYREQCQRLISLKQHHPLERLRQAAQRMAAYGCTSYKNVKKTAAALEAGVPMVSVAQIFVLPQLPLPLDLGLEDRPLAFYDQATEGRP